MRYQPAWLQISKDCLHLHLCQLEHDSLRTPIARAVRQPGELAPLYHRIESAPDLLGSDNPAHNRPASA